MRRVIPILYLLSAFSAPTAVESADPLPGTKSLTKTGDLARIMVDGLHKYLDRELAAAVEERKQRWKLDTSSPEAFSKSIQPNRERLRKLLGVVDRRLPPRMEYAGGPDDPALVAETDRYKVYTVRWAVLPGVDGEGLLLEPVKTPKGFVIALGDADWAPEKFVGLAPGVTAPSQIPRRMAEEGYRVIVPVLIDRADTHSGSAKLNKWTNQPHREFVHRMAYEMGRTLIGYEVQKVLAAIDWHLKQPDAASEVWLFGYGEGGAVALFTGALDDRVRETRVGGYVEARESVWKQPIYRNVWGLLTEFGDAELARLAGQPPEEWRKRVFWLLGDPDAVALATGPPAERPNRRGAAPGAVWAPWIEDGRRELARLSKEWQLGGSISPFLNSRDPTPALTSPKDLRASFNPAARQKRQFDQLVGFTQKLWRDSEAVRKEFWKKADASSPEKWEKSCDWYRDYFHTEVIGKLPDPTMPMNPRTRVVYDEPKWTGYEVVLDVYPDVIASGILLLPKGMKPGEKRPVVVCQHGLEGRPQDVCNPKERTRAYNSYGARLADRGYIVYAPQNPYIFENHFRQVQRKANPLKLSLFSFIIAQHGRTLDWLETLPNVDPKKIAFYGLSYGGKTAMRVPAVEKRYCLSICSGDFNEWIGKNVSVDLDRSYMWTREYEMYEFDLGNTFNYAEMAYLIAPRPFMVERGHDDGVGTDEMVAYEYARVRYLYANRLKLPDRTAIEFTPGGHEVFLKGTLEFLEKHLGKPSP